MGDVLSQIGLIAISILILYIIKKVDYHFYTKSNDKNIEKIDTDDEDE